MQKFVEGRYSRQEHLLADAIDVLDQIAYYSSVAAIAQVGDQKVVKKIHNGRPKERPRPGPKPVEKKKVFTDKNQAKSLFSQWTKRTTIDHIPGKGCAANDSNCGCPRRLVEK